VDAGGAGGAGPGRVRELLWRLDQRVLPPLVRAVARLGRGPTRPHLISGAALMSVTAILVAAVWATGQAVNPAAPTVGAVVTVGVVDGQSIPGYLETSRTELSRLVAAPPTANPGGETYALVALTAYLRPESLTEVLGDVAVSAVYARVPIRQAQTSLERISAYRIPDDVVAGMRSVAGEKDSEAADYRDRAGKLTGDDGQDRVLRSVYDSGARTAEAEARAYRAGCACVYAAVVRATPAALERTAHRREVRTVDPAPEVRQPDGAVFRPPLPEQVDVVRPPADATLDPTVAPSADAATASPEPPANSAPTGEPSPASASPAAPSSEPTPEPTASPVAPTPSATTGP
jgi:hypothetical protein